MRTRIIHTFRLVLLTNFIVSKRYKGFFQHLFSTSIIAKIALNTPKIPSSLEPTQMEDAMNKAAKYIENVTGKSYPNQYPSLNRGPGIGHKLTHSNDGNLVIVGGYDNHADTWKNVVRRLDCTTFKKTNLYPDCYWMDIQDGIVLTTGRKDHVAMMLHHKFCNFI